MRQLFFVVVMVAAAFLGGALVNGPCLRWAQARLLDYLGLKDGREIASVELPQQPSDPSDPRRPILPASTLGDGATLASGSSTNRSGPRPNQTTASAGSLSRPVGSPHLSTQVPAERMLQGQSGKNRTQTVESTASNPTLMEQSPPPLPIPTAVPEPTAPELAGTPGSPGTLPPASNGRQTGSKVADSAASLKGTSSESTLPAPLDASIGPALLASLSPSPSSASDYANVARSEAIPLETAPDGGSRTQAAGSPDAAPADEQAVTKPRTVSDWESLRRRMRLLGVSRYTIEGEPSGRVVFSCVIPLAGRRAVAQQFQAEGDDELHAAQAAIRRVALWQAARSATTAPATPAH
jgi:hypothetical protein